MWNFVISFVVSFAISYFLAPKPQSQKPPGVGEIKTPTAEEGREIPVLFGTRIIKSPNVVWYGDIKIVAIRKKGGKK
jgi:hypothetical protein